MPYPRDEPTNKHDLVCPQNLPPTPLVQSEWMFKSSKELFGALKAPPPSPLKQICFIYSYHDAPQDVPLSRALIICGFCDAQTSVVRKLIDNEVLPDCLHSCTLAVRQDTGHLEGHHQKNTPRFVNFMTRLRDEALVAIVYVDKHSRFGILVPDSQENACAMCYFGKLQNVKDYLTNQVAPSTTVVPESAPADESATGPWQPTTPPVDESATGPWQPTTPPVDKTMTATWQPTTPPVDETTNAPWQPKTPPVDNGVQQEASASMWKPPDADDNDGGDAAMWQPPTTKKVNDYDASAWEPSVGATNGRKRKFEDDGDENTFHADPTAAAADTHYSQLIRSLDTRADSRLFHMRSFNGWVKATQIQELNPKTSSSKRGKQGALRVLDLACGKGGDLGKWILHTRGISHYVGVDVARGSLQDAAIRARKMRKKLKQCTFTCADLGADVPGRLRSPRHKSMQKLLSWSLQSESEHEDGVPTFELVRGGGISLQDKFDVISIQFAIHYMMSTRTRARRFFQTASELLEVGGNLIATTIDARVVLERLMDLGLDYHFGENAKEGFQEAVVQAGDGQCRIKFTADSVRKIFAAKDKIAAGNFDTEDLFGMEYTFTLVEGSDHAAGVGDAVNLPEWLNPIPVLRALADEAGLELQSAENFHEFFANRKNPSTHAVAHHALYNMKVLDRNGSIPSDNWDISRMYVALKFRKVRESKLVLEEDEEPVDDADDEKGEEAATKPPEPAKEAAPAPASATSDKLLSSAMMKAKKEVGAERWQELDGDAKKKLIQVELTKLSSK